MVERDDHTRHRHLLWVFSRQHPNQRTPQCTAAREKQPETRWLYCVECPQYGIRLEALRYLRLASCLLRAFDAAYCRVTR